MLADLRDDEVLQLTRFPRHAVMDMCTLLETDIRHPTTRAHAIPVETQVLAALQFFGTGSYQWVVARTCGLSQSSVCLAIDGVTRALVKHAPTYIKFPLDQQTLRANKLGFHSIADFPNVVGAIDCSHIAIKSPREHEEVYVNRKGIHTVNIQTVCDAQMKILDLVAKWPGSTHDSFIWRSSGIHTMFQRNDINGWLLGEWRR